MSLDLDLDAVRWDEVREETTELLCELIRIDTTNPPGNETEAARFLLGRFQREGLSGEILESAPGRGTLIVRLPGARPGPRLMLLNHTDVVPVTDPAKWKYPPFGGTVAEGYVWGRGALDMKNQTAVEAMTMFLFKRLKIDFAGELIFVACADEERGAVYGAQWLMENHPERLRADYVINEGGGMPLQVNGRTFYTLENAEKGLLWLKLTVRGASGHGSMPHPDNALAKAACLIERLSRYRFPKRVSPSAREFIAKIGEAFGPSGRALARDLLDEGKEVDLEEALAGLPVKAHQVHALTHTTASPTTIRAGVKENVIPDACEFTLDCRFVPGSSKEEVLEVLHRLADELGLKLEDDLTIETLQHHAASESPLETDLYRALREAIREELPEAEVVPLMLTGATDSRFLRELGALAYGFCPLSTRMGLAERSQLVHNDNERVDLESLELGVRLTAKAALKVLGTKAQV